MRIGLVCPYSLSVPGGVQGQVLGLARSLRRLGHDVRVVAPTDGPPPDAGVTPVGPSAPISANDSVAPLAPGPAAQLRTVGALRDERFDVVHVHEPLVPGPSLTTLVAKPAPLVATFHAAGRSAAHRWLGPVLRRLADRIDHRTAVSDDARRFAQAALGGEYTVLFNGIEVDRFAGAEPWPSASSSAGAAGTPGPTILFVGRHEPRKGLAVLLRAMPRLPAETRLWVAGTGPETDALRSGTAGDRRIEWIGRIDDEEKASRLRAADVFCAPSVRGESFGVVLLEAMAAGTPVVASDLPGYRNVARGGADALLVAPDDPEALAAGLLGVLDDRATAERLVASGRERADVFSMDRLARRYLAIYGGDTNR
ncbi:MAG: glycosyltransferase family 4 protein [Acidimicrobiales bacterium]